MPNLARSLQAEISSDDSAFISELPASFACPTYQPDTHFLELAKSPYYRALITLRHYIKRASDEYFGSGWGGKNVDLFMLTPSVSSPMGPGSDSEAIEIKFGSLHTYLVDSSQFGFEPLLLNGIDKLYCYLPSMRGEDPDVRHLNQFFHCEAEMAGKLDDLYPVIEGYVKNLSETLLAMPNILSRLSVDSAASSSALSRLEAVESFPRLTFDEAVEMLEVAQVKNAVRTTDHGKDITSHGEGELFKIMKLDTPLWVTGYVRDRVPFYQKPSPNNPDRVINADLLFPSIIPGAFGGEVVGAGQRQDSEAEMLSSLERQGLSSEPYSWYIKLRADERYRPTSGFGLGVERFITWALGREDIKQVIPYPRLKNVLTYP